MTATYIDSQERSARSSEAAVRAVCDLFESDPRRPATDNGFDDVVLVRGGRIRSGVISPALTALRVTMTLEDGSRIEPVSVAEGDRDLLPVSPDELPIGIHALEWESAEGSATATVLVAPDRFPVQRRDVPGLALFVPTYSLWTDAEPLPSYDGLAAVGSSVAPLGVDTIATLPLYAPGIADGFEAGPYSPVSRFHWNELLVPSRLTTGSAASDPRGERVDWAAVLATRTEELGEFVTRCSDRELDELMSFLDERPDVRSYSEFVADDDPAAKRRLEAGQWLAERALSDAAAALSESGLHLALDLPVGARHGSWETATWPELFIEGASIGAPPDAFFAAGQDWALPPLNPTASRRDGHRVWASLLRTACRFSGVLRIDHVMQVFRLWWIPDGHDPDDGTYVHYPADELIAVAAIVATQTGTTIVGENLGTVPVAVAELLADWGLPGMYEEGFTLHGQSESSDTDRAAERRASLPEVPPSSWAGIRTHDMAPLAVTLDDLQLTGYRAALDAELPNIDVEAADTQGLHAAMLTRLRRSGAFEVVVDLDDLLGGREPHNVPGTISDANWSRRLTLAADEVGGDPRVRTVLTESAP